MIRWNWGVEVLWITAFSLLLVGILFEQTVGFHISAILIINAVLTMFGWLLLRGNRSGAPRYAGARRNLVLSISVIAIGSIIASLAELEAVLLADGVNGTAFLTGVGIFILGIACFSASLIFEDSPAMSS